MPAGSCSNEHVTEPPDWRGQRRPVQVFTCPFRRDGRSVRLNRPSLESLVDATGVEPAGGHIHDQVEGLIVVEIE